MCVLHLCFSVLTKTDELTSNPQWKEQIAAKEYFGYFGTVSFVWPDLYLILKIIYSFTDNYKNSSVCTLL